MNKKSEIETARAEWLGVLKKTIEAIFLRDNFFNDLCPQMRHKDEKDRKNALKQIAGLSKQISGLVGRLSQIGNENGIGFKTLLGYEPDEITATVLVLLVGARLDNTVSVRGVDDLIHYSGRDPVVALQVRNFFRSDGALYKFVAVSRGFNLDDCPASLRESSFNRVLGLSGDSMEVRCDAEAIVGRHRL